MFNTVYRHLLNNIDGTILFSGHARYYVGVPGFVRSSVRSVKSTVQNQNCLLVIRPRTIIHQDLCLGELVPSPHKRSKLSNWIYCTLSSAVIRESVTRFQSLIVWGKKLDLYISVPLWKSKEHSFQRFFFFFFCQKSIYSCRKAISYWATLNQRYCIKSSAERY